MPTKLLPKGVDMKTQMRMAGMGMVLLTTACDSDKGVTVFNPEPVATITSHSDGDTIVEGQMVLIRGSASDANSRPETLSATWYSGDETLCEATAPEEDGETSCSFTATPETLTIKLQVIDEQGAAATDDIEFSLVENQPPTADISEPVNGYQATADQLVAFSGMVDDPEDAPEDLSVRWVSSIDGDLEISSTPSPQGLVNGYSSLSVGQHAIELQVEDSLGKTDMASVIVTVGEANSAPTCAIVSPANNTSSAQGDTLVFEATATDIESDSTALNVTWRSSLDGDLGQSIPDTNGGILFVHQNLSPGLHTIELSVSDPQGESCTAQLLHTVGVPPQVNISSPLDGTTVAEAISMLFNATVSDDTDSPENLSLSWALDGIEISTQSASGSGNAQISHAGVDLGVHTLSLTATDSDQLSGDHHISFTVNGLPSSPTVTISPNPATTSDNLTATASGSIDPENQSIIYSYEWLKNGALTANNSAVISSADTQKDQIWTVRVTPNDGLMDGPSTETQITINNTTPSLTGPLILGTPYNDSILTCAATIIDPDQSLSPDFSWTLNGAVVSLTDQLDLAQTNATPTQTATCTASGIDDDNASVSGSVSVVIDNREPTLIGPTISPTSGVTASALLQCSATATDPDGEAVSPSFSWLHAGQSVGTGPSLQINPSWANAGDLIECIAFVEDNYGASVSGSASVSIENLAPIISSVDITPNNGVNSLSSMNCAGTATDPDGGIPSLSYEWTNLNTAMTLGFGTSTLQLSPQIISPGDTLSCTVTATDAAGESDTASATVTVENTVPTLQGMVVISAPNGAYAGETLECNATFIDQDEGQLSTTYQWQSQSGAQLGTGANLNLTPSNSDPNESIICIATAIDSLGLSATASTSLTVENSLPVFDAAVTVTPNSGVGVGTLLNCNATASDPDGDLPTLSYGWTHSDGSVFGSQIDTLALNPSIVQPGDAVSCTITATDNQGSAISDTATVAIENSPPQISVAISSSDNSANGQLECIVSAADPDQPTVLPSTNYVWEDDNGLTLGVDAPLYLDPSFASHQDIIHCVGQATDASGLSSVASDSITIANTPPAIVSIDVAPATPNSQTPMLNCIVSGSDVDGEPVSYSYQWRINGSLQSSLSSTLTGPFSPNDLIQCEATPYDGFEDGPPQSDQVLVGNLPPTVDSVVISPSSIGTDGVLTAIAVFSDPDSGQSISGNYEWHVIDAQVGVDTMVQSGGANSLNGSLHFDRDDEVYVIATPFDGIDTGAPLSSNGVIVENTAPTAPSLSATPNPAQKGIDDLLCQIDFMSTDMDGDALIYRFQWTNPAGVHLYTGPFSSATNSTFPANATTAGDWTCTVTPSDGDLEGPSESITIAVEAECGQHVDCPSGTYCATWRVYGENHCSDPCTSDSDCGSGETCSKLQGSGNAYICQPNDNSLGMAGDPCAADIDCQSAACVGNYCEDQCPMEDDCGGLESCHIVGDPSIGIIMGSCTTNVSQYADINQPCLQGNFWTGDACATGHCDIHEWDAYMNGSTAYCRPLCAKESDCDLSGPNPEVCEIVSVADIAAPLGVPIANGDSPPFDTVMACYHPWLQGNGSMGDVCTQNDQCTQSKCLPIQSGSAQRYCTAYCQSDADCTGGTQCGLVALNLTNEWMLIHSTYGATTQGQAFLQGSSSLVRMCVF